MDLLEQRVTNGRRFTVSDYLESGDQVFATVTITGAPIRDAVNVTQIFTFRAGTNVVTQMNDGVDVIALRAQKSEEDDY